MTEQRPSGRYLHITGLSLGNGGVHLVARCERCDVVAERTIGDLIDQGLFSVIASEALADAGCEHVDEVMRTSGRATTPSGSRWELQSQTRPPPRQLRHALARHDRG